MSDNCSYQSVTDEKGDAFLNWKAQTSNTLLHRRYREAKAKVQRESRRLMNEWWKSKAEEFQSYTNASDPRYFFEAIKFIYRPPDQSCTSIRKPMEPHPQTNEETLVWQNYFENLLNSDREYSMDVLNNLAQYEEKQELADPLTVKEVAEAIKEAKNNKAPAEDEIPAEVYKVLPQHSARRHKTI